MTMKLLVKIISCISYSNNKNNGIIKILVLKMLEPDNNKLVRSNNNNKIDIMVKKFA